MKTKEEIAEWMASRPWLDKFKYNYWSNREGDFFSWYYDLDSGVGGPKKP